MARHSAGGKQHNRHGVARQNKKAAARVMAAAASGVWQQNIGSREISWRGSSGMSWHGGNNQYGAGICNKKRSEKISSSMAYERKEMTSYRRVSNQRKQ